jgi:L-iditol 2-dehydrogenase
MRALVLHGPGSYRVEPNWPRPEVRPGWALVRVHYAGVCGSDLPRFAVTGSYRHPMILGHEFSGTVETPAPGSDRFTPGDEVAVLPIIPCGTCEGCRTGEPFHCSNYQFIGSRNDGGYAEFCLVPEKNLLKIPPEFGLRAGAFIEPIAVALHVVRRSGFARGKSALVFGAGAIGLLVGLWLRVFGASRVVIADIRADSLERARELGFAEVFDPSQDGAAGRAPGTFDALFEAAGSSRALVSAVDCAADKGTLTVVGRDVQDTVLPRGTFEKLMRKELTVHGCWGYNLSGEEDFLLQTLRRGDIPVAPMVTHEIALDQAPETVGAMCDRKFPYCKVLVKVAG